MNRDRKISIAVAVAFHFFVLFVLTPPATPAVPAKTYLVVDLAEGLPVPDEELGAQVKMSTQAEASSPQPEASAEKAVVSASKPEPQAVEQPVVAQTKEPEPAVEKPAVKTVPAATPAPAKEKPSGKQAKKEVAITAHSMANEGIATASPGIGKDGAKRGKPGGKGKDYYDFGQAGWDVRKTPEYPELALRRRQEGTVVLSLYINERGRLDKVEVKQSSGYSTLDAAAILAAKWSTFFPATQDGKPIAVVAEASYKFEIPRY